MDNIAAADRHIKRIIGPTILMGDGSYFDYDEPDANAVTIEDYAWGLAASARFCGQTRSRLEGGRRCLYLVVEHVVRMAEQMERDGCTRAECLAGLMHESDEVVFPDVPGPIKYRLGGFKEEVKSWGAALDTRFGVPAVDQHLIKKYDIRMLATEKRDLMPQSGTDDWSMLDGFEPFSFRIIPWPDAQHGVRRFLRLWERLSKGEI